MCMYYIDVKLALGLVHTTVCNEAHKLPAAQKYRALGTPCVVVWCLHTVSYYRNIIWHLSYIDLKKNVHLCMKAYRSTVEPFSYHRAFGYHVMAQSNLDVVQSCNTAVCMKDNIIILYL